jgi:hypothetical protein
LILHHINPPRPLTSQERTKEELLETLRITPQKALDFNRDEALKAAESDYSEITVTP